MPTKLLRLSVAAQQNHICALDVTTLSDAAQSTMRGGLGDDEALAHFVNARF